MSESDVMAVIAQHREAGVVVDTNLLLAYLVGAYDPEWLQRFKRTVQFTKDDFETLLGFLSHFARVMTTPGILAEVNSLSNQLPERIKPAFYAVFRRQIAVLDERHVAGRQASEHTYFDKCGLTDAAIMTIATNGLLVLTDDFRLKSVMDHLGIDSINFNHLRFLRGLA